MFCFGNRSIFPSVNVQASVKAVLEHDNADETEYKISLEDSVSPYMSGRWSKEKDTELGVVTKQTKNELPSHLRLIVTAQHAASGIISVTTKDFGTDDAKEGTFEKGLFIPNGSDYGCTYIRERIKERYFIIWPCVIMLILISAITIFVLHAPWWVTLISIITLVGVELLLVLLWMCQILVRANAFSSRKMNKINLLMIALGKINPQTARAVEDIEADEEEEKPKRQRFKREH